MNGGTANSGGWVVLSTSRAWLCAARNDRPNAFSAGLKPDPEGTVTLPPPFLAHVGVEAQRAVQRPGPVGGLAAFLKPACRAGQPVVQRRGVDVVLLPAG